MEGAEEKREERREKRDGEKRKEKRDGERKRQKEIETLDKTRRPRKLEGLEKIEETSQKVEAGYVISQETSEGTEIETGTKVKLLRESGNWYFTPLGWCNKKYISIV